MIEDEHIWTPGSFTKNFGWGPPKDGLTKLHEVIQIGFDGKAENVPRKEFRARVAKFGKPDYIPLQFFLYNSVIEKQDYVIADELVFQATNFNHSKDFDKLGMFAFLLSMVGTWKGARANQKRPAEWARHYVMQQLSEKYQWNASRISASDIEAFVTGNPNYKAKGARKVSTNLNYLFGQGKISEFSNNTVARWWTNCVFLALDRSLNERKARGHEVSHHRLLEYLLTSGINQLSGPRSMQRDLASKHLVKLYWACGATSRFSQNSVRELNLVRLPNLAAYVSNDPTPVGAVKLTDPNIQKTVPRFCAQLAKELADFEILEIDDLENLNLETFIRQQTALAIGKINQAGANATMTAEELFKLTREK